jgi:hypothetical protein
VFQGGQPIVTLLLLGYALVTQLFPALILALVRPGVVTRYGAIAGIVAGVGLGRRGRRYFSAGEPSGRFERAGEGARIGN